MFCISKLHTKIKFDAKNETPHEIVGYVPEISKDTIIENKFCFSDNG